MNVDEVLKRWLQIEYYCMARRIGFINKRMDADYRLIVETVRCLDYQTTMADQMDPDKIIAILALMWEHIDKSQYDIRELAIKILSRIGYPTSAIIVDAGYDYKDNQFSPICSAFDKVTLTLQQERYEVVVGNKKCILTNFQKKLWNELGSKKILGVSAPTSAGKSYVIQLNTAEKMRTGKLDVIYIVPTLSLLNQVVEDYHTLLTQVGGIDYIITSNLTVGESKADHTIYVWTQEKAISGLSDQTFGSMPNKTVLVVDEVQNIERVTDENDVRSKILYDMLQELRHTTNIEQVIVSGPRIDNIAGLGEVLFGAEASEIQTKNSPVLNLTYSIKQEGAQYWFKQYCGLLDRPYKEKIIEASFIKGYGSSQLTVEYKEYLSTIIGKLGKAQNIVFAPTSNAARELAIAIAEKTPQICDPQVQDLIKYLSETVHPNYALCNTLLEGVAYHHGKLPTHVRRTLERAIKQKNVTNVVCTTTLMQGVNLPTQNIIIRNPHLYRRRYENAAELTNYEMANLRGRAGRLMKDFVGRTIVLDEGEFEDADGYEQQTLFEDVYKEVSAGYGEKFQEYKAQIIDAVNSDRYVGAEMSGYGYLVTYIRQAVLRYGESAEKRMAETGVTLTPSQVAAIKYKLESLTIPKEFCLHNRYWDPVILDDIYRKFDGAVPSSPVERGAQGRLSDILKFLRDTESTTAMFNRYVPEGYRNGANRGILCGKSIKWASEIPLSEFLKGEYYSEGDVQTKIEDEIQMLQKTVSFDIPLLIKPVIEMKNPSSMMVSSLQAGAYKRATRKMIDIGIPRELAIRLNSLIENNPDSEKMDNYDYEQWIRAGVLKLRLTLPYWESVQLEFLG